MATLSLIYIYSFRMDNILALFSPVVQIVKYNRFYKDILVRCAEELSGKNLLHLTQLTKLFQLIYFAWFEINITLTYSETI